MLVTRPYRKVISLVLLSHEPSSRFDSELHGRFLTKLRRRLHNSFVRVSDEVRSPTPKAASRPVVPSLDVSSTPYEPWFRYELVLRSYLGNIKNKLILIDSL